MPTVADLVASIERLAPPTLAESWDNVGLLLGDLADPLRGPVVLTIDLTASVLDEALAARASAVIAYHPPIFHPMKRLTGAAPGERTILRAARAGLAIYSPHTALDAAQGGLADWLGDAVIDEAAGDGADRRALRPHAHQPATQQVKVVTFVPAAAAEQVRGALASAGAGIIGNYVSCSFAIPGTGTFLAQSGASPKAGSGAPGRLEEVAEVRLEMVCSRAALALALTTLRSLHPYEEPAIDVYALEGHPRREVGVGRRLSLDHPLALTDLAARVKARLGVPHVLVAAAPGLERQPVARVAVCPGDGGSLIEAASADGCQAYVTGEMSHHEVWSCLNRGVGVILAGHTAAERGYLPVLAKRLGADVPGVQMMVSRADADPLRAI